MDPTSPRPHKRRVRYKGTHPRHFHEKYKELDPQRYADDVEHVIARGQTPAGMHRPICVDEILTLLHPQPGECCMDATLGFGGHTQAILPKLLPGGRMYAVDVDGHELPRTEARLRACGYGMDVLIIRKMNFAGIGQLCSEMGVKFDCILADLGVSSMQLDTPERGFSYKIDGPLDLRLNPSKGSPASKLFPSLSVAELTKIFAENADEPHAEIIAREICRSDVRITSTGQLSDAIARAMNSLPMDKNKLVAEIKKSCQRCFMALRIAVNDEFGVLDRFLELLPWCLKTGGRVALLSFHSGEDRRVKKSFQKFNRCGIYSQIAPDPIRPSAAEQRSNPRSTSAKLRWAIRSELPMATEAGSIAIS
jgi:16S rRNA (cytosine1402-N4)-methyltransferase